MQGESENDIGRTDPADKTGRPLNRADPVPTHVLLQNFAVVCPKALPMEINPSRNKEKLGNHAVNKVPSVCMHPYKQHRWCTHASKGERKNKKKGELERWFSG